MLNQFQGFSPVKKGSGFLEKAAAEGITFLRGNAAECCALKEYDGMRVDFSGTTATFPSPGFGRRNEKILASLPESIIESVTFTAGERSYQMSGAADNGKFLLVTDLPVPEALLRQIALQCGKRVFLGQDTGELSIASLYRSDEKPGRSAVFCQKLLNSAYILLMNLAREEILGKGRLYEVDLLAFPERESCYTLGEKLLELGAFSSPKELLQVVFAHLPNELRSELEITLLSEKKRVTICKDDHLLPIAENLAELFSAHHVRLIIRLGYGGENLCCWTNLT